MEKSIYTYVDEFPDFASKIPNNQIDSASDIKNDCESFKNINLNAYNGDKEQFVKKCTNIVKYLQDKESTEDLIPAFCKYINYWFYNTLKDIGPFPNNGLLNAFYNKIKKLSNCKTYKKPINEEIYNELNELYKLHDHLIKYKKKSTTELSNYCDHAKKGAEIYQSNADKCKWLYNHDYCSSLKQFRDEYEKHRAQEEKCLDHMQYLTPVGYNPEAHFLIAIFAMSIISFVFIYFYKFTSFGSWLRPRLPGGKNKTKKLEKKMQDLKNSPDVRNSRYTLPYHSSYS